MLQALSHNQEVAENIFARTAKAQFKELIGCKIKCIRSDELKEVVTQWFSQTSVAIDLEELCCYSPEAVCEKIASMVHDFGEYVLNTVGENRLLLESLNTSIIRSGEQVYQFRIKQKWVDNG